MDWDWKYFKFGAISGAIGWMFVALLTMLGTSLPFTQPALQQVIQMMMGSSTALWDIEVDIGLPIMGLSVIISFLLTMFVSGVFYWFGKQIIDWLDVTIYKPIFKVMSAGLLGFFIVGGLLTLMFYAILIYGAQAIISTIPEAVGITVTDVANAFLMSAIFTMVAGIPFQLGRDVITWALYKAMDWNPYREFSE